MKQTVALFSAWLALACWVRAANPAMPTIPATIFNVTNYGAIGDGAKDNTTNIQNTINAASSRFRRANS
jgi:polygalacturonase